MSLSGKTVLISGASGGIGAAAARRFAAQGARVVLLARTRAALDAVAQEIAVADGAAHVYPADLTDLESVADAAAAVLREVGPPDILVNNAGMGRWLSIEEGDPAEALAMTMVPYVGAFALTHALAGAMIRRGSGRIVNVTSPAAFAPFPGAVAYSVARAAMRAFTNALHTDLRGTGVSAALAVCGLVESGYFEHNPGSRERVPGIARLFPTLTPEQAAEAIVRLAESNRRRLVVPSLLRWTLWLHATAPWLMQGLIDRTGYRRPPQ